MTEQADVFTVGLPAFAVLARFRVSTAAGPEAIRSVRVQLVDAQVPFHEIDVEREDAPGIWMVVARFVLASVDGHTAVAGLHATLLEAGLEPDEVWAAPFS
jgi:hypothetical protein